ncbi:hypothetical protein CMT52_21090 [Elizabethkingia anophelis]|nr:hypothetical protein [Elizabethkingia anophelis]
MKISKNSSGNIVLSTASDEIIAVIPPGQHVYPSRIKNNEVHISKGSGNFSEVNRITINSSEVTEAFGSSFSGNRNALIKLLSENFSSGSGGGGLDPKAYDLADFKNGSDDAFVRKSDESFWRVGGNPNTSYSPDGRILNYVGGLMQTVLGVVDYNKLTERLADNPRLKAIDDALNDIQIKQQQLYDDFASGKITAEEFNQKQEEFSREAQDLYQQRTVVFNEEAAKLKDVEGLQVLTLNNDSATFFKPVNTTNSIQATYYNDKISIWETRLGFYENSSYKYGYDGSEFIQHLKDLNTVARISSHQTMYNAAYSKDVVARYPNGTIAFLSSATNSSLSKFIQAPYNSGTAYFATDKPVVFTNLQNADGDSTFDKQVVINSYGMVGIKSGSGSSKPVEVLKRDIYVSAETDTYIDITINIEVRVSTWSITFAKTYGSFITITTNYDNNNDSSGQSTLQDKYTIVQRGYSGLGLNGGAEVKFECTTIRILKSDISSYLNDSSLQNRLLLNISYNTDMTNGEKISINSFVKIK